MSVIKPSSDAIESAYEKVIEAMWPGVKCDMVGVGSVEFDGSCPEEITDLREVTITARLKVMIVESADKKNNQQLD